jgi:hypothetical protein
MRDSRGSIAPPAARSVTSTTTTAMTGAAARATTDASAPARDATMRAGERARANAPDARARERGGQVSSEVRRFEPGE